MARRWNTVSPLQVASSRSIESVIQERSRPSAERPRLRNDALEVELEKVDRSSASCYADVELKTHQAHKLARLIKALDEDDAIPGRVDDEDSLVLHIEDLRNRATSEDSD